MVNLLVTFILLLLIVNILFSSVNNVLAQYSTSIENLAISNEDLLLLNINLNRMDAQIDILLNKINTNNNSLLFEHAYIPHSIIFPSIKPVAISIDGELTTNLENKLTDIPLQIRSTPDSPIILTEIIDSKNIIDDFYSKLKNTLSAQDFSILESQTMSYLLRDAHNSYGLYLNSSKIADTNAANFAMIDYENTRGLVNQSNTIFEILKPNMTDAKSKEIEYFITDLNTIIDSKSDNTQEFSTIVSAIENDLNESNNIRMQSTTSKVDPSLQVYYDNIDILLDNAISSIQNGNYLAADKNVSAAYLDNYEYLEAPIEEVNSTLMLQIETNMRENLRALIKNQTSLADIEAYISNIKDDLEISKQLLSTASGAQSNNNFTIPSSFVTNTANIDSLKQGFGIYTGERRSMGETSEDFKGQVRNDIDTIRVKLDEVIAVYNQNDSSQALATARSAYLDSYENIEIPLRPIDPDFTLDMEIKFAEFRNLITSNAPPDQVVSKIAELKSGLDESERFVSGIGVVAPAIAFSSSFSIIFREGLEAALILGAILTYLEASRNEKYKKHVYAGVALAIALTAVTWVIAEFIIEISGAQRELIEAIAGISAVAVLFWVSFWVLNKIETKKWIEFVKAKVWQATTTGSFMVFVLLSFFTVYREGFETVLFYQALFSFAKYMELYVLAGLIVGMAVIIAVVFIIRKLGKKLPLRVLFGLTMGVGAFMSITFLGNALREFQELGWIPTTHLLSIIPRFDINVATMTGIHPTLETVLGQVILLAIYLAGSLYILIIQPRRQQVIASMRKSVGDKDKKVQKGG
ncbi:FTR1 family iron permease [Candidatus Nitrosocosmicus arcticus]|uniref:High-affinity Fe2+/Pb2+ permease n=1 Tax=Candidatus Nitrosocosmicus arcticus TaxID=2035267 RepID=A0A557SV66_9ARCH|nr:FTR1 family protein [Candidatus Nitrosocosmicus arcticus]TVP40500.1 High-affinity Fe2+/Pb2+ permease [Candidatus Nitrosocosmicus arcticus]